MSLIHSAWWPEFLGRVGSEPLEDLAARYGVSEADALAAMVEASPAEGSVLETPWWPEAVRRLRGGASLRELSRVFGANLRRLRRGLARAGVRVAGQDLGDEGLTPLADFRDRLGQIPDSEVAELAGVTVEAVQGERRRLNIEPFRPAPPPPPPPVKVEAPRPAPPPSRVVEDDDWIPRAADAPERPPAAARVRRYADRDQAVERRPPPREPLGGEPAAPRGPQGDGWSAGGRPPVGGPSRAGGESPTRGGAGRDALEGGRRWSWDEPEDLGVESADRGAGAARGTRAWRRSDAPEPTVIRRPRPAGRPEPGRERVRAADEETPVRSADEAADPLSAAAAADARERRGRLRIVRPDAPTLAEPPADAAPRALRRRREPAYSPVRVLEVDEQLAAELAAELVIEPAPTPVAAPSREPEPAMLVVPELDATPLELPPAADLLDVPPPAEARVASLPPIEADELPHLPAPPRPRASRRAVRAPAPATPAAATGRFGWLVHIEGRPAPLLVVASDILTATSIAAATVGAEVLGRASIVQLGPELVG